MSVSNFTLKCDRISIRIKQFLTRIHYDKWKGWVYLAPCIVLLLVFTGWPIVNTLAMAFQNGYDTMEWLSGVNFTIGIDNFLKVISYSGFKSCLFNTILLCVITVPISTLLALLIAVCLNSIKVLSRFLQTIYFLPYVTNSIAIGMVFAAMFNMVGTAFGGENELIQSAGIINNILGVFGVDPINWINEGSKYWSNIFVMSFYIIWNALPFKILILLGGLQSVNKQYYDAAKIDSTPKWRVFSKITVPLLSPMIAYVVITGFIGGFKEYSSIVGIFGDDMGPTGDPRRLNTMVGYIYNFIDERQGQASAAALILFGIIFVVTMINLYVSKKKTHF
jgi:multiple sugar transport system permease protein